MKTPSDHLYKLIQSLTKNEKGYFKKYTSKHVIGEGNFYVKLFDEIESQKAYDEKKLVDTFKKYPQIKNLTTHKSHLFTTILSSLRAFHAKRDILLIITNLINDATMLKLRGLFDLALKINNKALKLSINNHLVNYQLISQINDIQIRLELGYKDTSIEELEVLLDKNILLGEELQDRLKAEKVSRLLFYMLNKNRQFANKDLVVEKMKKIIVSSNFESLKTSKSIDTRIYYYNGMANYYTAIEDNPMHLQCIQSLHSTFTSNPESITPRLGSYINYTYNAIYSCIHANDIDGALKYLSIFKNIEKEYDLSKRRQADILLTSYQIEITINLIQKNFKSANTLSEQLNIAITKHSKHLPKSYIDSYIQIIATCDFFNNKLDQALDGIDLLLKKRRKGIRQDLYRWAKLFQIMIHYQQGNYILLDSLLLSLSRLIKEDQSKNAIESLFIKHIKAMASNPSQKNIENTLQEFKLKIAAIPNRTSEKQIVKELFLETWLEMLSQRAD